ncbi:hypothetical protein [Dehalococcoides mccartyi]|jgi:hypothetical protein|uniref:SAV-6107-like HEPN domain-containing protein n=1 Tax=Dehalococcoides mccartyi (strain CBDB1) TaxID=255470 RepID=A0A916KNE4_DEHMC|nr:hypothetical protein [Dehalococcoides mccartyi]AII61455.1 hypothetical protein X794_06550 [Dehalococcoides mccartyi CG5]AQX73773.1 hypothetical protein B1775_06420 [Dehalococcoides mccartyi]AQX75181.1 hypothetical protein B1776_06520 [Dehalococcoides mccartyi]CAI83556.1 hypothetical protein cbdbB39 [Dehalococcoides mccartyi CBDB1]
MDLKNLLNDGRIKEHTPSKQEIKQLLAVFDRDITDAQIEILSTDRKFSTAYNAALTIARIALVSSGYRITGEGSHYWTIQASAFILPLDTSMIRKFDKFRQKRNISGYEMTGMISEQDTKEMIDLAREIHSVVLKWLSENHPEFI